MHVQILVGLERQKEIQGNRMFWLIHTQSLALEKYIEEGLRLSYKFVVKEMAREAFA